MQKAHLGNLWEDRKVGSSLVSSAPDPLSSLAAQGGCLPRSGRQGAEGHWACGLHTVLSVGPRGQEAHASAPATPL